ncbi:FAD-dependent oxidoreductase [Microcoleus sp. FACHB-672]|uniref:FAD-dependent oxidoreductase n=1 Tax=Microcoleus sp. FACHB-672 TaxID=2692825 RepID=UPI0016895BB8|nr:FAD-dependent oxidoreductase [Microcoleus sp. FACHB-672]MBD2039187.1 FAD-dependent oxidoreductase [Microcoleus sp. FACHB-672]
MQEISQPIDQELVLIGGGHSNAIVLQLLGAKPLPGVRITLIANTPHAPYSGMLPGYVAGFYKFDECHINLRKLAQFAGAKLIIDEAIGLDLANNKVLCANSLPVAFDVVSVDIGSTPATISVPGATEFAIPAKPVPQLLESWHRLLEEIIVTPKKPHSLGIVGGGAGGVELALAMDARLRQIFKKTELPADILQIHIFHRDGEIMPSYNRWVRRHLQKILTKRAIQLHLGETVCAVEKQNSSLMIHSESGLSVECDRIFWVTQASAPAWLQDAGLATDERGFIQVNEFLQSVSHPQVFAAGDVATIIQNPCPKAGVFAVRQGKPLYENLRRSLLGESLKPYQPQKQYLSLIGTGTGSAIASRGAWGFGPSPLLWWWKDWIDRRFMAQFSELPVKPQ